MRNQVQPFNETAVIYFSSDDGCWIAHGLRTDQIGTGDRLVDALSDFLTAVTQVLKLAGENESIAYLREAPQEVQDMAKNSQKLPHEVYEVAHLMAFKKWPDALDLVTPEDKKEEVKEEVFTVEGELAACA